jgi:hypothetical protein
MASETVYVVYSGLDKKVKDAQLAKVKNVPVENVHIGDTNFYPIPAKNQHFYYDMRNDSHRDIKVKVSRRKSYLEERKKEIQQSLADQDAVLGVAGFVFEKGKPVKMCLEDIPSGKGKGPGKRDIRLEREKILSFINLEILKVVDGPGQNVKPAPVSKKT